ncbi:uncharacterized protein GGS25DRAFT_483956 [Hypoxylon fragiforme]|uniref:uncharacterized protein n=1 Tax=Hypoxylon fragiforme TaxID=63214 RepID=UPI0020C654C4|nr:uncharacterized protein GGS25DRAFT_483956 [Hypoxylon fragiforme]KAI2611754.1 hypothetical protein GGS25DRAFT_483956 [Hypoxylon fragiforme]
MFPSITQATQVTLLEWADSMLVQLLPGRNPELRAKKPEHLFDGAVFSALLEILDTEYNPSRFQQSHAAFSTDGDVSQGRRRNLHIIHMGLKDFARRHCSKIEPLINQVDFQALGKEPTKAGMSEILVLFVSAACFREDDNTQYITLVTELGPKLQQGIFQILKEVNHRLGQVGGAGDGDLEPGRTAGDLEDELAQEAALAELQREADEAKRQASGLKLRLDRLQDNYDELLRKHEELQEQNQQLHKQIESEVGNFDKHRLQRQLKENETLIANLENERNYLAEEKERLLKDKARLEVVAQKAELLADENQELRSKNEDLSKKANMADNLRKKLESLKTIEVDLKALQSERVDATKLMEQLSNATIRNETLKRETEAYATKMQGYEIDIANFNNQKTMYTAEIAELRLRLEELHSRSQIDEGVVRELQEKVLMLDPSTTPTTPIGPRPTTLEDELNESSSAVSMRNLELQRLQAENAVLKSSIGTETEKGQLIHEMEDIRNSRDALQARYNDILEKFTVGQHQLDALIQNMGKDGDEAFSNLRTQVLAEQNRTKQLERQLSAINEELADKERALLEARGDLNAVEKSSLDALAELKKTDGMLAVSLRAELELERKRHKGLREEFENQRTQLLTAFIEKDQLRREAEAANRELQRAADGLTVSTDSVKQSEKMEKLRGRYKQLSLQYEQSESKNRELERTLKAVRAGVEAGAQKAQTDQIIKNLQRENAMITTAWYDLTSRLQSNHVVLQRRQDVPKSWLNKQRQMVNATPRK